MGWVGGSLDGSDQTIISTACSFQRIYNHNNIRSIILKIKTTDIKSLKYYLLFCSLSREHFQNFNIFRKEKEILVF